MIEVTHRAVNWLMNILEKTEWTKDVRLCLLENDKGVEELSMTLVDEHHENDIVTIIDGITFVVDKDFYERAKPFFVDFIPRNPGGGFRLASRLKKEELCFLIKGVPDKEAALLAVIESCHE
jgi:Fe-S cluster assembly iron-binding protein IscA